MTSLSDVHTTAAAFEVGDEVVVRLDDVQAMNAADNGHVPAASLPHWTIGSLTARVDRADGERYALRFRHGDDTLICVVPADAIEGLA